MPRECKLYLRDILESIEKIEKYTTNMSFDEFRENDMVVDGVIRNLEIIGEAVKNLSGEIKTEYLNIEWKKIAGLRDIICHEYFGVDLDIIWDVIENKIPELKTAINKIMEDAK